MSILGSAYVLDDSQLSEADSLFKTGKFDAFWKLLHLPGVEVDPDFGAMNSGGYVLSVAVWWLQSELNILVVEAIPAFENLFGNDQVSVISAMTSEGSKKFIEALKNAHLDVGELRKFYEEFGEVVEPEAGTVMAQAIDLLRRSAENAALSGKTLLAIVG